ncbi:hypothetical protein [Streptomyces sp. ME19-01-6]|uniref:hypothetical protein n=1 Tax=Streptomyces sp. ME19-01-6 TaxID=3028686 RepID=UPI00299FE81D|nr:hypothetical protein [Streptomyces sp. ME19-01-6]MDX3231903.1 hypothetical protein [Streptomyces sp. ME19-01-6]
MTALRTLAQFASTAAIGPLHCHATLNEIAATLWPPRDFGRVSKRRRWPHLFAYGDAELCVCRCRRITLISVQTWRDAIELPVPGTTTLATFAGPPTHTQVTAQLNAVGCRLSPVTLHQPPGQLALQVETTGVTFTFRAEADSEPLLESAGHWISSHECTPPATDAPNDGFGA